MNYTVVIDWKFPVALGIAVASVIFAVKMNSADAKEGDRMFMSKMKMNWLYSEEGRLGLSISFII